MYSRRRSHCAKHRCRSADAFVGSMMTAPLLHCCRREDYAAYQKGKQPEAFGRTHRHGGLELTELDVKREDVRIGRWRNQRVGAIGDRASRHSQVAAEKRSCNGNELAFLSRQPMRRRFDHVAIVEVGRAL